MKRLIRLGYWLRYVASIRVKGDTLLMCLTAAWRCSANPSIADELQRWESMREYVKAMRDTGQI